MNNKQTNNDRHKKSQIILSATENKQNVFEIRFSNLLAPFLKGFQYQWFSTASCTTHLHWSKTKRMKLQKPMFLNKKIIPYNNLTRMNLNSSILLFSSDSCGVNIYNLNERRRKNVAMLFIRNSNGDLIHVSPGPSLAPVACILCNLLERSPLGTRFLWTLYLYVMKLSFSQIWVHLSMRAMDLDLWPPLQQ